jgi:hypothetical protein
MNESTPRVAGDVPPDRRAEEKPAGADPDTDATTEPEESPSTPQEEVPSEEDVKQDLPGVPEEAGG